MTPQDQVCPRCGSEGKRNRIGIHSRKENRYCCKDCGRTFTETYGTALYGLKKPELFITVVSLLAYGCPVSAIEKTFGLSNQTVRDWLNRSGSHCYAIHEQTVGKHQWDLQHIQADEIKVTTQIGQVWMALVMMVSTRLWLGGSVDMTRSVGLIHSCMQQAARCALCRPLLIAVDGMQMYERAVKKTFRSKLRVGKQGRAKWVIWSTIVITKVIKRRRINGKQKYGNIQRVVVQGSDEQAHTLRVVSGGGRMINTAYIERLNATFRQRSANLVRRTRSPLRKLSTLHASMFLIGCTYNFCTNHRSLSVPIYLPRQRKRWVKRTPAMVAELTDHCWTIQELLMYKVKG